MRSKADRASDRRLKKEVSQKVDEKSEYRNSLGEEVSKVLGM
jgi:hypothetical protein